MYYKLIREQAQDKAVVGTLYAISHYYNKRTGEYVEKRTREPRLTSAVARGKKKR